MSKLKCRRCRKIHDHSDLVRKPMKASGWTKNVCPNCGGGVFDVVETKTQEAD
jgi:Zn finger protein HypA/HybF involved in hydrogenase expression